MQVVNKVFNIINYTKNNNNSYTGKNFDSGYHSFILEGKYFQGARDNLDRINRVKNFDFHNKTILDLGCNMGGMLHAISSIVSYGVGIDKDTKCINVANAVKSLHKINNLDFYVFDLDTESIEFINNFIPFDKVDICFFLAVAQHIKKWREVIDFCTTISEYLLFESNGKLHFQKKQIEYVKSKYHAVEYIYSYGRRNMYLCYRGIK